MGPRITARKRCTCKHPVLDGGELQWGRALLRGKGAGVADRGVASSGFNGAAHYCAEKVRFAAIRLETASRFNGAAHYCAEKADSPMASGQTGGSFNGAAHYCAEKGSITSTLSCPCCCFNGAAHYCAEKARPTGTARTEQIASMGPRITARKR